MTEGVEDLTGLDDGALSLGAWEALGDVDQEDECALLLDIASDFRKGEGRRQRRSTADRSTHDTARRPHDGSARLQAIASTRRARSGRA